MIATSPAAPPFHWPAGPALPCPCLAPPGPVPWSCPWHTPEIHPICISLSAEVKDVEVPQEKQGLWPETRWSLAAPHGVICFLTLYSSPDLLAVTHLSHIPYGRLTPQLLPHEESHPSLLSLTASAEELVPICHSIQVTRAFHHISVIPATPHAICMSSP